MTEEQDLISKAIRIYGSKGQVARQLGYTARGRAWIITAIQQGTYNLPPHKLQKLKQLLEKQQNED